MATRKPTQFRIQDVECGSYCILCQVVGLDVIHSESLLMRIRDGTYNKLLRTNYAPWFNQATYGINILVESPWKWKEFLKVGAFYIFSNITFSMTDFGFLRATLDGRSAFPLKMKNSHPLVLKTKRKIRLTSKLCKWELVDDFLKGRDYRKFEFFGAKSCHPQINYGENITQKKKLCDICNSWSSCELDNCPNMSCNGNSLGPPQLFLSFVLWSNDIEIECFLYGAEAEKFFGTTLEHLMQSEEARELFRNKCDSLLHHSSPLKFYVRWRQKGHFIIFQQRLHLIKV